MKEGLKQSFEYDIAIQSKERCKEINKHNGTHFKDTSEHIDVLTEKIHDAIFSVGETGGFYEGDGIRVKVKVEYIPENK